MECAPLVRDRTDPEQGDHAEFSDGLSAPQPSRSRRRLRTLAAVLAFAAVATAIVPGPVHDHVQHMQTFAGTFAGTLQEKWSFSDAWSAATSAANVATAQANHAYNAIKAEASKQWEKGQKFLNENISADTKKYLMDKLNSLKAAPAWAQKRATEALCSMKPNLAALKSRLAKKMKDDFVRKNTACGKDFKSIACRDDCVADACNNVPLLYGAPDKIAGFNVNDILKAPKNMCKIVFSEIVKHIQDNLEKEKGIVQGQQSIQSETLLESTLNMQMGEVDEEFAKICK